MSGYVPLGKVTRLAPDRMFLEKRKACPMSSNEAGEAVLRTANFITSSLGYEGSAADFAASQRVRLTEAIGSVRLPEVAAWATDEGGARECSQS